MNDEWRKQLFKAVSPLQDGVRNLNVNHFRARDLLQVRPARTAAVLVPILDIEQPEILLTRRAADLNTHAGQISFPGGSAEEGDDTAVTTALREAEEEIGLRPDRVTPVGFLDRFDTVSDYRVLPIVGLIKPPQAWKIDHREVDQVFTLPLEIALDRTSYKERVMKRDNERFLVHSIEWKGNVVWGLTAAMLINLIDRLEAHIP